MHSCKKATGTSKNDALAIPTSTGVKKISMGPSLKDTSKEDLRGSKFKGDGCMMYVFLLFLSFSIYASN